MEGMIDVAAEVREDQVDGPIKGIFGDIKQELGVNFVPVLFRLLAVDVDYLTVAWRALKPNVQTVYFADSAHQIRGVAGESLSRMLDRGLDDYPPDFGAELDVFHYLNPELLLCAVALRAATKGQVPLLAAPSNVQRRPGRHYESHMEKEEGQGVSERDKLDEVREESQLAYGLPVLDDDYRALARWPPLLSRAVQSYRGVAGEQSQEALRRTVTVMAEETVLGLPFRMDISPHTLRHAGLSEPRLEEVGRRLDAAYGRLPYLIAQNAFFRSGSQDPRASRASVVKAAEPR